MKADHQHGCKTPVIGVAETVAEIYPARACRAVAGEIRCDMRGDANFDEVKDIRDNAVAAPISSSSSACQL